MNKKLTIGKKIGLGFALVIIIVIVAQWNTYSLLGKYDVDITAFTKQTTELDLDKEVKAEASHLWALVSDASLMKSKEKLTVDAKSALSSAENLLEKLKALNNDNKEQLARIEKLETNFNEVYRLGVELFNADVNNSGIDNAMSKYVSKTDMIFSEVSKVAEADSIVSAKMSKKMLEMSAAGMHGILQFSLFAILISLIIAYFITNKMKKPVLYLNEKVKEYERTGENIKINVTTNDEIGDLGHSFQNMIDAQNEKVEQVIAIANGKMKDVKITSEIDPLSKALKAELEVFANLMKETDRLVKSSKAGKLQDRADTDMFDGEWKELIIGINSIIDAIMLPINDGAKVLDQMATGDFTTRVTGDYHGDHQKIKNSINNLGNSVVDLVKQLTDAIEATASASTQISSSAEEMAAGAQEQSAQTGEVSAAVEQMAATIVETTQNASQAAELAKQAGNTANEGGKVVKQTIDGIESIAKVVSDASEIVEELGVSSDKIGEIIQVIDDIADQTNLLALNAAIEAARAGEQGRGFAVVADEVRKLAERTTTATKEIADMIKQIQSQTAEAVKSMRSGKEETEKGKDLAKQAGTSLGEIKVGSDHVMNAVEQVATASEEQSATVEQISKNVEGINTVAQESAAGVEQIARASEDLNRLTDGLQSLVQQFKINVDSDHEYLVNGDGKIHSNEEYLLSN